MHEEGFSVERRPDGALRFRWPNGWVIPEVPQAPPVPPAAVDALRQQLDAQDVHIDQHTSMPGWLGERLDVGYAIDVLHPRALGSTMDSR